MNLKNDLNTLMAKPKKKPLDKEYPKLFKVLDSWHGNELNDAVIKAILKEYDEALLK